MKNKTKLLVGAVALLTATGAGIGTASYAWFTSTRTANISTSPITTVNTEGSLSVTLDTTYASDIYQISTEGAITPKTGKVLNANDISGDGSGAIDAAALYLPTFEVGGVTDVASVANAVAQTDFVEYKLIIKNEAPTGGNAINVYLSNGTAISPVTASDEDTKAANSARVAVCDSDGVLESIFARAEDTADAAYDYVNTSATGKKDDFFVPETGTKYYTHDGASLIQHAAFTDVKKASDVAAAGIAHPVIASSIAAQASVTVIVRSWLEGLDPDCVGLSSTSNQYSFNLSFVALDA